MAKPATIDLAIKRYKQQHTPHTPKQNPERMMNPLSDFLFDKNGRPVSESGARIIKAARFSADVYDVKASAENGRHITLGEIGATIENVDFIHGTWFVQRKFPHKIIQIDGANVVLGNEINTDKDPNFKIYGAKRVFFDCYGPKFGSDSKIPDYFVAKYEINNETIFCGGATQYLAESRMKTKLYEKYKNIIHFINGENNIKTK